MALLLWPWGTSRLYSNSVWNQFCSGEHPSYVVGAPGGDRRAAVSRPTRGSRRAARGRSGPAARPTWRPRSASAVKLGIADDDLEAVARLEVAVDAHERATSRRSSAGPSPAARDRLGGGRARACPRGRVIVISWSVLGRTRARRRRARRRRPPASGPGGPTCCRRTRAAPLTRQYAGAVARDDEQLGVAPVDEPGADVDERAEHLGHPAARRCWCRTAARRRRPAAADRSPRRRARRRGGDGGAPGSGDRQRVAGRGRARCAAAGRSGPAAGRRRGTPAATSASVSATRWRSAPSGGDEHEQHARRARAPRRGRGRGRRTCRRAARRRPCRCAASSDQPPT